MNKKADVHFSQKFHMRLLIAVVLSIIPLSCITAQTITREWIEAHYRKREVMIPMRDGIHLHTTIYEPKETMGNHPILMSRTPYGCYPYGNEYDANLWGGYAHFIQKGYILVYQDVRGRRMSEDSFSNVRPVCFDQSAPADDASDAYDTAEWLLKHTACNGNIGVTGTSYVGYYTLIAALSAHPAIKAICPQAPIGDWFMGDDVHHNGALMLSDAFNFLSGIDRPHKGPSVYDSPFVPYYTGNERDFFLGKGALKHIHRALGDSISIWNEMALHPDYDEWWQERNYFRYLNRIKAAVFIVGGLFDAEDQYGTWNSYQRLIKSRKDTSNAVYLLIGPWSHGAWNYGKANTLGAIRFSDDDLGRIFTQAHQSFFDYYLLNEGNFPQQMPKSSIFFTGENCWHYFTQWPPPHMVHQPIYLHDKGKLSFEAPIEKKSSTSYLSDPSDPVPYTATQSTYRDAGYMIEDQRFASQRADVISFRTDPLKANLTIGGPIEAELWVNVTGTDADFVVKLIDVYPSDDQQLPDYEMPVRFDIMRGKYRHGFTHPIPLSPQKTELVKFTLCDAAHTFKQGHRIMIQIQSSWFPLADRNPQQFTNIWSCDDNDYVLSTISIYHQRKRASCLLLPILP